MKKVLLFFTFIMSALTIQAQDVFKKGDNMVSASVGVGSGIPVAVSYERGIVDNLFDGNGSIGLGGYLGYYSDKDEQTFQKVKVGWKYNDIMIGVRGNLHYQFVDKLDTYAGLMLGYEIVKAKAIAEGYDESAIGSADGSGIGFAIQVGARYFFTDNFGAFAEVGYGIAYASLGVSLKF